MSPYHWILATLAVLMVLTFMRRYWKSSSPPSLPISPPITTLQGLPPELRNIVYEFVAINTSMQAMRVVSGKKLVAAYEKLHAEHHTFKRFVLAVLVRVDVFVAVNTWLKAEERRPDSYNDRIDAYEHLDAKGHRVKLVRTNLKWYLGLLPMPNVLVPVPAIDMASILPSATARHPLSITSRQMRAEFQAFDGKASGGEYLFILNNFDLKQMGLIAASIHALDTEVRARNPPVTLQFHVCFTFDRSAVSSAKKLCSWIEYTNTVPLGLEYIAHKMTKIQVKTALTFRQAGRVHKMFWDLRCRTKGGDVAIRPIRFVDFLFQNKVKVHRPRGLGTWAPSEVKSWDAMARVSMS
jgi:hypothetical protein